MTEERIGIVVIGRNEGDRLIDCLTSLQSNISRTVYVDSGSADDSVQAATRLGAHVICLDPIDPFTAARARNEGFAALRARMPDIRLVQFIDGDCELVHGWLEAAVKFISQRDDVAVVCGRRRERHPLASIYNRLCDMEWNTPIGQAPACGGDSLVRTDAFEEVGGFRPQLIAGEEPEMCLRLRERGWKIWRIDAEMTQHDAAMLRFSQWWLRTIRCGYGTAEVALLHCRSRHGIWRKEILRGAIWGGLIPLFIVVSSLVTPIALAAVSIYPVQMFRIAIVRGGSSIDSWIFALFATFGKFAEFKGILKFVLFKFSHRAVQLIEYK